MSTSDNSPIILAYSGGLDTSFCVPWLKETYGRDVVSGEFEAFGGREWSLGLLEGVSDRLALSGSAHCLAS